MLPVREPRPTPSARPEKPGISARCRQPAPASAGRGPAPHSPATAQSCARRNATAASPQRTRLGGGVADGLHPLHVPHRVGDVAVHPAVELLVAARHRAVVAGPGEEPRAAARSPRAEQLSPAGYSAPRPPRKEEHDGGDGEQDGQAQVPRKHSAARCDSKLPLVYIVDSSKSTF